ncbi:uncharacterized protein LOC141706986 isoform X2 [Apium graveolens]|uniref:uncharacterized protein LOC141706986 isoform X2 n=1 Tax=Apium graveolens TaxID=4045 RepID=UPI003D79FC4D
MIVYTYSPHNFYYNILINSSFTFLFTRIFLVGNKDFTAIKSRMGGEVERTEQRKPRFLCLHGFRTSGLIFKTQLDNWPEFVLDKLDLVIPDAPFPCNGKSGVDGIFDPPYYEWFQANQGSFLSAALPGLQAKGLALTKVPKIKFLIIISGGKFKNQALSEKAFSNAISCPSLHFIGEMDILKPDGIDLLESFVDPIVIHHPEGHTVPKLDEKGLESMLSFLEKTQEVKGSQSSLKYRKIYK